MPEKRKIYTKGGDLGETSLINGTRVSKSDSRVEAYGTLDELNAFVGLLRDTLLSEGTIRETLLTIQENLFIAEALIAAGPGETVGDLSLTEQTITALEEEIDHMTALLPPLNMFILPGGDPDVSRCHVARTVCRRAERCVIRLHQTSPVPTSVIRYLNRLSDYFFVLARKIGQNKTVKEITWPRNR